LKHAKNPDYQLPQFSKITIDEIETQIDEILQANLSNVEELLQQEAYNWDNLIRPMEEIDDRLHKTWSPVNHMNAVVNSDALRQAYNACLPKLSEYGTRLRQNEQLFTAVNSIINSDVYSTLNQAQQKLLTNEIRDFKLAGVALPEDQKKQFATLCKEMAQLTAKFEENILDASMGWTMHITNATQLRGIPEHAIKAAQLTAQQHDKEGWLFTLEFPSFHAVITFADSRELRQSMYTAYTTRASDQGPNAGKWDNSSVMQSILEKRLELARMLDFNNYAEYSLATKMVKKTDDVLQFINNLVATSQKKAQQEFKQLEQFSQQQLGIDQLTAWDLGYCTEKLRQYKYNISQEELRPYFPEAKVIEGLFTITNKLFGISIRPVDDVDTWHKDVQCYALYGTSDNLVSLFYFDLYARENKRGGAWMDDCRGRRRLQNGNIQAPIAYITCNFNPPLDNQPALFTHEEVVTLFHEFGHGLQHMLTTIDYIDVAGINGIPWDAVEVASQFLENWAWEKESITLISGHFETGEPLPEELFKKMHRAKNFQSAMQMMRQLEFSLFDFRLHMEFDSTQTNQIQQLLDEIRKQISIMPAPDFNRFQHSFSHIFAGGYAAGYYSYKWAEVMAADAFSLFEEKGIFDHNTSQLFLQTFLQSGGTQEPLDLFIKFRGRKPEVNALLKQSGIIK